MSWGQLNTRSKHADIYLTPPDTDRLHGEILPTAIVKELQRSRVRRNEVLSGYKILPGIDVNGERGSVLKTANKEDPIQDVKSHH
jgi:hypothetical protein